MSRSTGRPAPIGGMLAGILLWAGCGTVVGNPKKPDAGKDTNKPGSTLYAVPALEFDLGDDTLAQGAPFSLAPQDESLPLELATDETFVAGLEGRSLFNAYGRRFNGVTRTLDATTRRLNMLALARGTVVRGEGDEAVVEVVYADGAGQLAARFSPSSDAAFDREAVLCGGGKPFQFVRWKTDGSRMDVWRDLARGEAGEANERRVVSRVRVGRGDDGALRLDVSTFGTWSDGDADARGQGIVEHLVATRAKSGEVTLRAVTDRFEGTRVPARFEGDAYIVARLSPLKREGSGRGARFDPAFVAYSSSSKRKTCASGFDEAADDVWAPAARLGTPRFCLARAPQGVPLQGFAAFTAHVKTFEPIGLAKKAELTRVVFPEGLACPAR